MIIDGSLLTAVLVRLRLLSTTRMLLVMVLSNCWLVQQQQHYC
jgi:hypothetical protein